ncbi:hypothetical protein ACFQY7_43405 [Actinomadura luteofluorescens]|uniref:PH domain-containing protein n=1 Tax=Actinomadura luteofluorescens TaxID=46163 RepID=A0A7Y9JGJ7_9ACTN|nr:hypothetical protein [Actinomadura luteofluorescens]NYD47678.1 hypothetical protein [Actinomadura luteofluorescens]
MAEVQDELVIRPDFRAGLIVLVVIAVAAAGIVAAIVIGDAPAVFALIVGGLFAVMIPLAIGALLSARISLTAHELVVQGLFYRKRLPRSRIAEVVRASITAPRGGAGMSLFVLDAQRALLVRVQGSLYPREDLSRLVDVLDVPCSGPDGPVSAKEFAKTYPGLVSWIEQHPYRLAFVIAGFLCAAVAAVALVSIATTS